MIHIIDYLRKNTATRNGFYNHDMDFKKDGILTMFSVAAYAVITPLFQRFFLLPLARKAIKISEQTVSKEMKYKEFKFVVAANKMFHIGFFLVFSALILKGHTDWLFDASKQHIPFKSIPLGIKSLYYMKMGYYLYTLVTMFYEPKMKDRNQMVVHHIFTLVLHFTSYYVGALKYGVACMVLHDFSDPWMEAAKLFNYANIQWAANLCFAIFALSYFYLLDYVFPYYIIRATFYNARPNGCPYYTVSFISLIGLWVLHMIWSYMICRVFYEKVLSNKGKGDLRGGEFQKIGK